MHHKKPRTASAFILILSVLLIISSISTSNVNAKYNIKEGDTFRFHMDTLRNTIGGNHSFTQGALTFEENITMRVKFTLVEIPYIKYSINIKGYEQIFSLLSNIIVQNRTWDKLTAKYEAQGYEIYEDNEVWGVRQDSTTVLTVDFLKRDGVLNYFYAANESQLKNYFGVGEIEISRTGDGQNNYWAFSFLAIIPVTGLTFGLVAHNKKVRRRGLKMKEL